MDELTKEIQILEDYIIKCIDNKLDRKYIDMLIIRLNNLYVEKLNGTR